MIGLIPLLLMVPLMAQLPPSALAVLASPVRAVSALGAWRINADGVLELRTTPNVNLTASFDAGGGNRGPRLWIDFPGTPTRARNIAGAGPIKQVLIGAPEPGITRLVIEFLPGTQLDPTQLKLEGVDSNNWKLQLPNQLGGFIAFGEGSVALEGRESTRKIKGICSELSTHEIEIDSSPNPSIQRLMALQRRNASREACNVEQAESNRRNEAERNAEIRRNRVNWKTYGEVQIPWGLWFEPLAGKRVNGFLGSSNSLITWVSSIESYGPTGAPNGISVSCSTGTFSINTNPNWNRVQSGWTKWAAPARDSNWERIVIDLCSPIVNR